MLSPKQLLQDISAGKFKPAYYFYGLEDYRVVEAEKFVVRQFLPQRQFTTNFNKIDCRKTKSGDLINLLSSIPMLGEKQAFVVRNFQSYKPTEVARILSMLVPADHNRIVIFSSPSSKAPNKKSAFFTAVSKAAEAVEFNKLTYQEVAGQIRGKLEKEEIKITPEALKLLTEMLSGSKGALDAELTKLSNFKSKGETVEHDDIKYVCSGYEVFNIFELADLIVAGKAKTVLKMVRSLLAEGNTPSTLISLLQQHFTSLYLVKNGKKPLGRRDFLIYKFKSQAEKYDNRRLEKTIVDIAAADAQLRHKGIKPEMTLEMLAMTLAGENK